VADEVDGRGTRLLLPRAPGVAPAADKTQDKTLPRQKSFEKSRIGFMTNPLY
jgi:hypothetical protein